MRTLNVGKLATSLARFAAFDGHTLHELSSNIATLHYTAAGMQHGVMWSAGYYTTQEIVDRINSAGTNGEATWIDRDSFVIHEKTLNIAMLVRYTIWGTHCILVDHVTKQPVGAEPLLLS